MRWFGSRPKKTRRTPLPGSLRAKVLKRDGHRCRYCGRRFPAKQLHVDHVVPVARGGRDDERNLVTACVACNLAKGATMLDGRRLSTKIRQFRRRRRRLAKEEIARLEKRASKAGWLERKAMRKRIRTLEKVADEKRRWWLLWLR